MINAHYWAPEYYDKDTDELGLLSKKHWLQTLYWRGEIY
jgi:hypothetical protein